MKNKNYITSYSSRSNVFKIIISTSKRDWRDWLCELIKVLPIGGKGPELVFAMPVDRGQVAVPSVIPSISASVSQRLGSDRKYLIYIYQVKRTLDVRCRSLS